MNIPHEDSCNSAVESGERQHVTRSLRFFSAVLAAALAMTLYLSPQPSLAQGPAEEVANPLQLADQLAAEGKYGEAIPYYREAHDRSSGRVQPLLGLGRSLMALGQYDEARRALQKARDRAEGNIDVLESLGTAYLVLGDLPAARDTLESAATRGGRSASLFASLGTTLAALGEFDLATSAFDNGLNYNPGDLDLLSNKGLILVLSNDSDEGIALLERAAASIDSHMDHRLNLAFGDVVSGNVERARKVASVDLDVASVDETIAVYEEIAALPPANRVQALLYGSSNPRHDLEKPANFVPGLDPADAAAAIQRILNPPPPPTPPALIGPFMVFFDFDKSDIRDDARAVIEEAAQQFLDEGLSEIILDGHADRAGSDPYNLALSDRRAAAVKAVLTELGIDEGVITTIGHGERDPLVETDDGVREQQNRRVLITLRR